MKEKLKFIHLNRWFRIFWFIGILTVQIFYCSYNWNETYHNIFCYCFSNFQTSPNEVNIISIYVKEDILVRGQFHECINPHMRKFANSHILLKFTAQMRKLKCANSQMLLVTISRKFLLNFQLNFSKRQQGLVNKNFNQMVYLRRLYIHNFLVKAITCYWQTFAKINSLFLPIFFRRNFFS